MSVVRVKTPTGWVDVTGQQGPAGPAGTTDHGALTGLADADHPISAVQGLRAELDGMVSRAGAAVTLWAGTRAEYDAIPVKDPGTVYAVTG